ncbi:hypothetical protein RUND412_000600 [Rhizina undulata]
MDSRAPSRPDQLATYQPGQNSFSPGSNAQLEVETYPNPNLNDCAGTNVGELAEEQIRIVDEQIRMAWEPMDIDELPPVSEFELRMAWVTMGMDELPPISGFELNADDNLDLKEYDGSSHTNAGTPKEKRFTESGDGQDVVQGAEVMAAEGVNAAEGTASNHFFARAGEHMVARADNVSGGAGADAAQAASEDLQQSENVSAAFNIDIVMQAPDRPDVRHRKSAFFVVDTAYNSGSIGHEPTSGASNIFAAKSSGFNTSTNNNAVHNIQRASTVAPEITGSSKENINDKGKGKGKGKWKGEGKVTGKGKGKEKGKQRAEAEIQNPEFSESTTKLISKEKVKINENEKILLHLLKDVSLTFTNNLVSSLNQHQDTAAAREKIDKALQLTGGALEMVKDWVQKPAGMAGNEKSLMEKREKWAMGQTAMVLKALAEAAGIDWEEARIEEEVQDGA